VVLITGIWNYLFKDLYVSMPPAWATASIPGQIAFVTANPLNFLQIIGHTLVEKQFYLVSFVGLFGWTEVPLPDLVVYIFLIVLIAVAVFDRKILQITIKQKLLAAFTFLAMFGMVIAYEYITFTPVGIDIIYGVQGRYFIPVAPLLFLIFYSNRDHITIRGHKINLKFWNYSNLMIILFSIIILIISIYLILGRYYAF